MARQQWFRAADEGHSAKARLVVTMIDVHSPADEMEEELAAGLRERQVAISWR